MPRHYLDHASTSPPRPAVAAAVRAWFDQPAGDPGRIHHEGMASRVALEEARATVADFLGARPREVVFTSGATESIAAACWGATDRGGHQVVSAVEHSAVREAAAQFAEHLTTVGVDPTGRADPDTVLAAVRPDTSVVHLQWANHEVGTCQPVAEVTAACRERGVLVHVDAAQACGRVHLDFRGLGADLLSVSAHKFGGPPGVGVLVIRRGLRLRSLLVGGDQERARRAGLEDLPGALGLAAACRELAEGGLEQERAEAVRLTDRIRSGLTEVEGVAVHGHPIHRLPHLVCVGIEGIEPQPVVLGLDRVGVAVHSGSACATEGLEPSPVLAAMGLDAQRSLRASVGWNTTDADVDALLDAFPRVVGDLRRLGRDPAQPPLV